MTKNAIKGMHVPRSLFLGFEHLFDDLERIHGAGRSQDARILSAKHQNGWGRNGR